MCYKTITHAKCYMVFTNQPFDIVGAQSVYMARRYSCITLWAQVYTTIYTPILVSKKVNKNNTHIISHLPYYLTFYS